MPWLNDDGTRLPILIEAEPAGTWLDRFGQGFARENLIASGIIALGQEAADPFDPSFDPFPLIRGTKYEGRPELFVDANSAADVQRTIGRLDTEAGRTEALNSWAGTLGAIAGGIIDPINLVPVGGQVYRVARTASLAGRLARGAAETAAVAAGTQAVQEAGLQATQLTRPIEESALNVAGAAVLGGVLGGAVGALRRPLAEIAEGAERETEAFARTFDPSAARATPEGGSVGAAARRDTTMADETLAGERAMTATRIAETSPGLRLATSPSLVTRQLSRELVEIPLVTRGHEAGIAEPIAAERLVRMWDAPLATATEDAREAFVVLRGRGAVGRAVEDVAARLGPDEGPMTQRVFAEAVGRAMRRGDASDVSEVAQAARAYRALFDKLRDASVRLGLLAEDAAQTTAQSYLPRVYLRDRIRSRRPEFQGIVTDWLSRAHPDVDELRSTAAEITDHILGVPSGRTYFPEPITRGPLKDRTFNIPDVLIEDFLENDIRRVARYAVRTVAPDIALARKFGTTRADEAVAKIVADYDRLRAETPNMSARQSQRLEAARDDDVRDFTAMWETVRGTYGAKLGGETVYAAVRDLNAARLLGGMTLSALPDMARAVAIHGMQAFGPLPKIGTEGYRAASREVRLAGTGLDRVLSTTANARFELDEIPTESAALRLIGLPGQWIGTVSGMNLWNSTVKGWFGIVSQNRIFETAAAIAEGRQVSRAEARRLASIGIDDEMARRINAEFRAHGSRDDGLAVANTERWDDAEAVEAFRAALAREVDTGIVTPGAADRPLAMIGNWGWYGKILTQFQSYAFSSMTRVALAGLQQHDARMASYFVGAMTLGALSYTLKELAAGRAPSDDPRTYVSEALDKSGVFGWLFQVNNLAEKMTGGTVGVRNLLGVPPSKYAARDIDNTLLGPSWGLVEEGQKIASDLATGTADQGTVHAARKVIPYQNLFYLRWALDQVTKPEGR